MQSVTRRGFLAAGAAGVVSMAMRRTGDAAETGARRNVLFISVDDLNPSLGCFGNSIVKTPNVDKLAARGVRFTRAYSQWPSCLPSRASFLSGWYPTRTGVHDFSPKARDGALKDVVYLRQHFRNNGYFTARLDKVFHIGKDDGLSWDVTEEPYRDETGAFKAIWTGIEVKTLGLESRILKEGGCEKVKGEKGPYMVMDCKDGDLFDGRTAARAVELLEQSARDGKPFFLACGFRRPHLPWIAPQKYFDMYSPEAITLPPRNPDAPAPLISDDEHRELIAHYYACVSYMDAQVGKVLDALARLGLDKNTLVVFFGDQGYCLGERDSHFGKGTLWDRSFHVPVIVAEPGIAGGVACDRPIGLVDMYPTLVARCGLPQPASGLQGADFSPLLSDTRAPWRDHVLSFNGEKEKGRLSRSVRTSRYRYTETSAGVPVELVNYDADPYEWHNRVADAGHAGVVAELKQRLAEAGM